MTNVKLTYGLGILFLTTTFACRTPQTAVDSQVLGSGGKNNKVGTFTSFFVERSDQESAWIDEDDNDKKTRKLEKFSIIIVDDLAKKVKKELKSGDSVSASGSNFAIALKCTDSQCSFDGLGQVKLYIDDVWGHDGDDMRVALDVYVHKKAAVEFAKAFGIKPIENKKVTFIDAKQKVLKYVEADVKNSGKPVELTYKDYKIVVANDKVEWTKNGGKTKSSDNMRNAITSLYIDCMVNDDLLPNGFGASSGWNRGPSIGQLMSANLTSSNKDNGTPNESCLLSFEYEWEG